MSPVQSRTGAYRPSLLPIKASKEALLVIRRGLPKTGPSMWLKGAEDLCSTVRRELLSADFPNKLVSQRAEESILV